jgi:hypothetical protein
MMNRRAFTASLGGIVFARTVNAAPSRRLALLFGAPWKGENFLANGVGKMQEALQARGLGAGEMMASHEPLDRERLMRRLVEVRQRISSWRDGNIFLYYDGHGMYSRSGVAGTTPEPGLQLTGDRDDPNSALLWRELWDTLRVPPGVRVLAIPDCCHTNLLARRLPGNVTAVIMKSTPQDTLICRTGGAFFGEGAARKRYGVISYYAGSTVARASTAGDWLAGMDAAAEQDVATGTLEGLRRPQLMVEGDAAATLPGLPVGVGAHARTP